MRSSAPWIASILLLVSAALATLVTIQNQKPPPGTSSAEPVNRINAFYSEYARGGSCEWRQRIGAPSDPFPTLLLVALLAYPAAIGAAAGFLASLSSSALGSTHPLPYVGLVATVLVLVWLVQIGFVRAALGLC